MSIVRVNFGAIKPIPAPFFVGWLENDEHFYVYRDDDEDFERGCYATQWQAYRAAQSLAAWNTRAEGVAALQQAGEPVASLIAELLSPDHREPVDPKAIYRTRRVGLFEEAAAALSSPIRQQVGGGEGQAEPKPIGDADV